MLFRALRTGRPSAAVRNYSISSSKPGGGRYFTSAKPAKHVPPTTSPTSPASPAAIAAPVVPPSPTPVAPAYPRLSPSDLRLHQFFSLHRPLFLQQTPATLFARADALQLSSQHSSQQAQSDDVLTFESIFPEASTDADADADAARQLARALAVQRVGAAVQWEDALRNLGLQPHEDSIEMDAGVLLDSTRRKRKKKMKKHKLKKRRRLNRMKEEERRK